MKHIIRTCMNYNVDFYRHSSGFARSGAVPQRRQLNVADRRHRDVTDVSTDQRRRLSRFPQPRRHLIIIRVVRAELPVAADAAEPVGQRRQPRQQRLQLHVESVATRKSRRHARLVLRQHDARRAVGLRLDLEQYVRGEHVPRWRLQRAQHEHKNCQTRAADVIRAKQLPAKRGVCATTADNTATVQHCHNAKLYATVEFAAGANTRH